MASESTKQLWREIAATGGVSLCDDQLRQFDRFLDLLAEANSRMNLTRIADRAAAELHHIADALSVLAFLPRGPFSLADLGSGGGVPGIVLAIARPDGEFALIESTGKKADFLRAAATELKLNNVSVLAVRAEDVGQSSRRETFDVALSRAVATLDWLAEWSLPLLKKGGCMLAMKGPKVESEIPLAKTAIKLTGGGKIEKHAVVLPGLQNHLILRIEKIARSGRRFPRPASIAKGRPVSESPRYGAQR